MQQYFRQENNKAEIFPAQGLAPMSLTPVANGKNHQTEKFL
jgi:hypothetical protein